MLKGNLVFDIDSKIQIKALFDTSEVGGLPVVFSRNMFATTIRDIVSLSNPSTLINIHR